MVVMRIQRWLFWIMVLVMVTMLLPRLWNLRLLYLDPAIRSKVQATLERTAEDRGWLLSDISVHSITYDRIKVNYRPHHRGARASSCFLLPFEQTKPIPCSPPQ